MIGDLSGQKRPETVAAAGMGLQLAAAAVLGGIALTAAETALFTVLALQCGVGFFVFLAAFIHLRLRRLAAAEKFEREQVERSRAAQGLVSLFSADDVPPAARNLQQMNRYAAPAISLFIAILLAAPAAYCVWQSGSRLLAWFFADMPLTISVAYGLPPILTAFVLFILGTYASGLCRQREWRCLRAGAGYALTSAAFLALAGAALLLGVKIGFYPARIILVLTAVWTGLQAAEIFLNVILDHYRPRLPGIEPRPAYDSRLSGLLAEPEGMFKTFANALDYQFGFRISDTWFFRFVEKSLAPLLLIMILTLYLLSCFVVVAPGQAAVIERFGAPRGLKDAASGATDWDAFARAYPPLKNGVHFKYPWPIETVRIVAQARPTVLTFGFDPEQNAKNKQKIDSADYVANWDAEHQTAEYLYLMPLSGRRSPDDAPVSESPDVVQISGTFLLEYRIDSDGDVYRFLYNHRNSQATLRAITERELTVGLAGDDFWKVLTRQGESGIREKLHARITAAAQRENLGLTVSSLAVANLHPPAGETGKAFLEVTASLQKRESEINNGKVEAIRIIGLAPAEAAEITDTAAAYEQHRIKLAEADAAWFASQMQADVAASGIFRMEKQMQTLENALGKVQKILLPENTTMIMDDTKAADPNAINNILAKELNKLNQQ